MALTQISQAGAKDEAINEAKIQISNAGTNGQYLQKQSGNTGGLTWADVPAGVGGATGLDLNDSVELRIGNSQDFRLYHDGTNTQIRNTTGLLTIGTDTFNVYALSPNETMLKANSNGNVELYYNGIKTFETHSLGIKVIGDEGGTAQIDIQPDQADDNADKWKVGATDSGHFFISNKDSGAWDTNIECNRSGNVELYYDASKKLETTSTGATVTGNLLPEADNTRNIGDGTTNFNSIWASTRFRGNDNVKLVLGNGQDLVIRHDGTDNLIESPVGGDLKIMAGTGDNANETCAKFIHDGGVELYHNNVKKFETKSNGIEVTDTLLLGTSTAGQSGEADSLTIYKNAHTGITIRTGTSHQGSIYFADGTTTDQNYRGTVSYDHSTDSLTFKTAAAQRLHITNSGVVRIPDSGKFTAGAGDDLQIYHDASGGHNHIHGTTNCPIIFKTNDSERCRITSNGNLNFENDSSKLQLGTGQDLQLYHDGSNSRIKNTTGSLYILGDRSGFINAAETEWGVLYTADAGVELYYNGSKKIETTSLGVNVTGDQQWSTDGGNADELHWDSSAALLKSRNGIKHTFGSGGTDDLSIYHDGNHSYIQNGSEGGTLYLQTYGENSIKCFPNGSVELFHDASKKVETISTGVNITGGVRLGGNNAANEMDDYEEGTISVTFTAENGTISMHSSYDTLAYTKIGRVVHVQGYVNMSSVSSVSGWYKVGGFPFAPANLDDNAGATFSTITTYANGPDGNGYYMGYVEMNEGDSVFKCSLPNYKGKQSLAAGSSLTGSTDVVFDVTYIAA